MIKVSGLSKSYHNQAVLNGIELSAAPGQTLSIIGPSGSGKSTLIRCLNLLEKPTSGLIEIDGISLNAPHYPKQTIHQLRQRVGMVFQSFNLFPHLSALDNVALGLTMVHKKTRQQAIDEAQSYLAKVGLSHRSHHFPSQLSGGQQQRVAIARTIAMQPKVILMDEPTSALDPELVQEVLQVIKDIAQSTVTTLIVTHELSFAKAISHQVVFMDNGQIIEKAPPEQLFNAPNHVRTKAFLSKLSH